MKSVVLGLLTSAGAIDVGGRMISNTVNVATRDGSMEAYYSHPDEAGNFPAVIVYMDAPGYREELKGFACRIAANGYFACCPTCTTASAASGSGSVIAMRP